MDAQKFLAEFGHIANAPGGVSQLRELVLVLAVQGRLVAQAQGEKAGTLLERIEEERRALVATGSIRSPKPLPDVGTAEQTHPIPERWAWVRFGSISMHNSGKTLDSMRNSGHPRDYITTSNLYWGRFELNNVKRMLIRDEEMAKCTARKNDLLICEGGEAGRAAVWTSDTEVCFQNHIHRARFYGRVNPFFAYRFFEKLNATGEINAHRKGIGISNLSSKALAMIAMPLPPLEEQARIVARVDELMALCDTLETRLQDGRDLQRDLRQSVLQAVAAASPYELKATWERLEANFKWLFSLPEDIAALKSFLLSLAVRGLLVEQAASDTPGRALLMEIEAERRSLLIAGKLKGGTTLPPLLAEDLPYQLPSGWQWARLTELVEVGTGATPSKSEPSYYGGDIPWYTSAATNERIARAPSTFISAKALDETNCKVFPAGSLIVALYGQGKTRGQISEISVAGATNQALAAMVFFESSRKAKRYIKYYFEKMYEEIRSKAEGGPQPNLNVGKIKGTLVPVPPIEEQERIVGRLDELFALCDRFIVSLRARAALARQLARASVASLTGIEIEQEEDGIVKAPQTELVAPLRIGIPPSVKAQAPLTTLLMRHDGEMPARDLWQRFGGAVDAFYAQLKTEVAHGWILEPTVAVMREKSSEAAGT